MPFTVRDNMQPGGPAISIANTFVTNWLLGNLDTTLRRRIPPDPNSVADARLVGVEGNAYVHISIAGATYDAATNILTIPTGSLNAGQLARLLPDMVGATSGDTGSITVYNHADSDYQWAEFATRNGYSVTYDETDSEFRISGVKYYANVPTLTDWDVDNVFATQAGLYRVYGGGNTGSYEFGSVTTTQVGSGSTAYYDIPSPPANTPVIRAYNDHIRIEMLSSVAEGFRDAVLYTANGGTSQGYYTETTGGRYIFIIQTPGGFAWQGTTPSDAAIHFDDSEPYTNATKHSRLIGGWGEGVGSPPGAGYYYGSDADADAPYAPGWFRLPAGGSGGTEATFGWSELLNYNAGTSTLTIPQGDLRELPAGEEFSPALGSDHDDDILSIVVQITQAAAGRDGIWSIPIMIRCADWRALTNNVANADLSSAVGFTTGAFISDNASGTGNTAWNRMVVGKGPNGRLAIIGTWGTTSYVQRVLVRRLAVSGGGSASTQPATFYYGISSDATFNASEYTSVATSINPATDGVTPTQPAANAYLAFAVPDSEGDIAYISPNQAQGDNQLNVGFQRIAGTVTLNGVAHKAWRSDIMYFPSRIADAWYVSQNQAGG